MMNINQAHFCIISIETISFNDPLVNLIHISVHWENLVASIQARADPSVIKENTLTYIFRSKLM